MNTRSIGAADSQRNGYAYNIETFKDRDDWIAMILAACDLCPRSKVLLARIALHRNVETGRCDPGIARLVSGTGLSDSTIRRRLKAAEAAGWISIDKTKGRYSNSVLLLPPPTLSHVERVEPCHPSERVQKPTLSKRGSQPCQNGHSNPVTADGITTNLTANRTAKERDSSPLDLDQVDPGQRRPDRLADINAKFEEFYAAYPKKVAKVRALPAYRAAVGKGATPTELLDGAIRAAAEFERAVARRGRATAHQ